MLDSEERAIILRLRKKGKSIRSIAKALRVSRNSVRKVLSQGTDTVPAVQRNELAASYVDEIRELYDLCKGNLVRVHEKLTTEGETPLDIPYSTLTGFCRRHEIGTKPKEPKGRYHFKPGSEMQHDTSPHDVMIGGKVTRVQCASVVLCFSRMLYAQCFPTFNRFYCRIFLQDGIVFLGGAAAQIMLDNSTVVIARGTGKNAIPAAEMKAFADRFGTRFVAHEVGDANRSARVEGPFYFIERNFYPGRTFSDLDDLNRQLRDWCEKKSHRLLTTLQARPIDLYQTERRSLKPLPAYIPEICALHSRLVDLEGYVNLHTNRYSVDPKLIDRRLEVRETKDRVLLFDGPRRVAEHVRHPEGARARSTLPEHCHPGRKRPRGKRPPIPGEQVLRGVGPEFCAFLDLIGKKHGRAARRIRRLHRMYLEYPTDALRKAILQASRYGLTDLERLERMTLRHIAGDYFRILADDQEKTEDQEKTGDKDDG